MNRHVPSATAPFSHFQRNSVLTAVDPGSREAKVANLYGEILTVDDVAGLLRMTRQQIYEQTRRRARIRQPLPLPFVHINGNLRFRRSDIATWLDQLAEYEKSRRIQ